MAATVKPLTDSFTFDDLSSYQEVLAYLHKDKRREKHLLLGNGFSMAYDPKIFSYNALYDFVSSLKNPVLKKLFDAINTKNFELIMRQLDNFIEIAKALEADEDFIEKLKLGHETLQKSLIDAVSKLHPEHVFSIDEGKSKRCFSFLTEYLGGNGKIFSTNYDLLLYWVLMRNDSQHHVDGFGQDVINADEVIKGEDPICSSLYWGKHQDKQNVFYVHGTLPIFDNGVEIEKETFTNYGYLLDNIKARMEKHHYPVFVTAGDGREKLEHIMHNKYLTHCYDALCELQGSLITFGFGFGEYDGHIIDALNKAAKYGQKKTGEKLHSVYIGVYSLEDLEHVKKIQGKFKCKVNVYNAQTANIWSDRVS